MNAAVNNLSMVYPPNMLNVMLDGRLIGYIEEKNAKEFT